MTDLASKIGSLRFLAFDFDGVFTDNAVWLDQNGVETVRCSRSDGLGLRKLRQLGIGMCVISTEVNPVVAVRSEKLKIECFHGIEDKLSVLDRIRKDQGLKWSEVGFMGNDINDLECLGAVGLAVVVQDAHPDVMRHADYVTRIPGGYGAVRELCDMIEEYSIEKPV